MVVCLALGLNSYHTCTGSADPERSITVDGHAFNDIIRAPYEIE